MPPRDQRAERHHEVHARRPRLDAEAAMFTGLIADLGTLSGVEAGPAGTRLQVATALAGELGEGDSVAVSGVCLTATRVADGSFAADVMPETLRRSSLAEARPGARVNLELPLRAGAPMGGHVVQGHVDGVGRVRAGHDDGLARRLEIDAPPEVLRYVVEKGSIAVDGVSLTVAAVDGDGFAVSLIPETLRRTSLGTAARGAAVNLEADVLAKYVERLLAPRT
jgi:riboflavin synthase